jgi:hypothetical protein
VIEPTIAELKRVWRGWAQLEARRPGLGSGLGAAELAAADLWGDGRPARHRSDLVEARRLYARHGYTDPPYHDDPYAEHFFEKRLG